MAKTNTALDEIGRPTSDAAKKIHDAKGLPDQNYATNSRIAEKAATYVHSILSRMEMSRHNIQDKFTVWYALWNGSSVADYFPTARPVHVPEPYKAVEGFVPRAASLLVEQPGWFRVVGMDDRGKKNVEKIKKLILAQLKRDKFYSKFRSVLRNTAIYGYCPAKVGWKKKRRKVRYNKVTAKPSEDPEKLGEVLTVQRGVETEINEDGPSMDVVDVFDFLVDYRFHDHQHSPGVVFRCEQFEDEIRSMGESGHYANVEILLSAKPTDPAKNVQGPPGTMANPATFKDIRDFSDGVTMDIRQEKASYRLYEIYEFWGLFDPKYDPATGASGEEKEFVITLGRKVSSAAQSNGGWVPLRVSENPYWHGKRPAVVSHYTRRAHAFHSVGIIEPIVNLSAELDDSRNMGLAARGLASKPVIIASDDADVYSNNLILDPGSIVRARSTDALKALFIPDRSDTAWKSEEVIKSDIRETTGIVSTFQGSSDAASETATSVVSRTREANKRISESCKNIAEEFLVPMLEMFHSLNQQMITKERMVELIGEDGLTVDVQKISPEDVAGMVGFEIIALPEIEVAGLKARMLDAFTGRAMEIEGLAPGTTRLPELLKMSYVAQFGSADLDRVFPSADSPLHFRSAMDEHYILGMGHDVDVQEGENYLAHFQGHSQFAASETFEKWPEDAKRKLLAHMMTTKARLEAEVEQNTPRVPPPMGGMDPNALPPQSPPGAGPAAQPPQGAAPPQGMGPTNVQSQVKSDAAAAAPRTPTDGEV